MTVLHKNSYASLGPHCEMGLSRLCILGIHLRTYLHLGTFKQVLICKPKSFIVAKKLLIVLGT